MLHEHNRPERDQYIELKKENKSCSECCVKDFVKIPRLKAYTFQLPYDYCSLLHYGNPGGSDLPVSGCLVIPKILPVDCTIKGQHFDNVGQTIGLSRWDKETIRRRYNCRGSL